MILYHFSDHEQITPHSVEQPERADFKPRGLWLSVAGEHDWESWCRDENFPIGEHRHRVTLVADHGLLVLATPDEVLKFTSDHGSDTPTGPASSSPRTSGRCGSTGARSGTTAGTARRTASGTQT